MPTPIPHQRPYESRHAYRLRLEKLEARLREWAEDPAFKKEQRASLLGRANLIEKKIQELLMPE